MVRIICLFWYVCLNYFGRGRNYCFLNKVKENLMGFFYGKKFIGILLLEEVVKYDLFILEGFFYVVGVCGIFFLL